MNTLFCYRCSYRWFPRITIDHQLGSSGSCVVADGAVKPPPRRHFHHGCSSCEQLMQDPMEDGQEWLRNPWWAAEGQTHHPYSTSLPNIHPLTLHPYIFTPLPEMKDHCGGAVTVSSAVTLSWVSDTVPSLLLVNLSLEHLCTMTSHSKGETWPPAKPYSALQLQEPVQVLAKSFPSLSK